MPQPGKWPPCQALHPSGATATLRSAQAAALTTAHLLSAESVTCWGQKLCFVVYPQDGVPEEDEVSAARSQVPASETSVRK